MKITQPPATGNADFDNWLNAFVEQLKYIRQMEVEYVEMKEITAPGAPGANRVRIYAVDSGGKTQLAARFPSGAAQQIAIEP